MRYMALVTDYDGTVAMDGAAREEAAQALRRHAIPLGGEPPFAAAP